MAGHVKSHLNLLVPSGKAKYSSETDSKLVPWGKDEKSFKKKSEIEPETIRWQAAGALFIGWRRAFCIMSLRVNIYWQG